MIARRGNWSDINRITFGEIIALSKGSVGGRQSVHTVLSNRLKSSYLTIGRPSTRPGEVWEKRICLLIVRSLVEGLEWHKIGRAFSISIASSKVLTQHQPSRLHKSSEEIQRTLMLRDWLRTNKADREICARTKQSLAGKKCKYVQNYAQAKSEVIRQILERAEASNK